jgi:hypothetical protein
MNRKSLIFISLFILAALLLASCAPTEVIKTVEVEVTRMVTEEIIVEVTPEADEEPAPVGDVEIMTLSALAEAIRSGEVDVGDEFGVAMGQRFHTIHAETVGMACNQCHVQDAPEEVAPAAEGAPGVVDRRVCVGCHLNGPATPLYEAKE